MENYTLQKTNNKSLFRVVDQNGDWKHYYYKLTNQYLRAVNFILDAGYNKGKGFEIWLKNASKEEADKKLRDAGERGDKVHKFITYLFLNKGQANRGTEVWNDDTQENETLTFDEWDCVLAFQGFWEKHQPILIAQEYPTYNLKEGYAGTCDAIITLTKECDSKLCPCHQIIGKVGVWDWKSGSGIRNSYGAQIAAYAKAENIKRFDYTAVLRLGTNHKVGYEVEVYDKVETEAHWQEFLAAKTIHNADYKSFDATREIRNIPDTISITIKKPKVVAKTTKLK